MRNKKFDKLILEQKYRTTRIPGYLLHIYDLGYIGIMEMDLDVLLKSVEDHLKERVPICDPIMLILSSNGIGQLGCCKLKRLSFDHLFTLELSSNRIGAKGCKILSQHQWPNLERLNLSHNYIDDTSCKYLSKSKWPNLQKIMLDYNLIQMEGCKYLSQGFWVKIFKLYIKDNDIKDEGLLKLIQAQWPSLVRIKLFTNTIKDRLYVKLKKSGLKIDYQCEFQESPQQRMVTYRQMSIRPLYETQ